jgi:hypothetical protein
MLKGRGWQMKRLQACRDVACMLLGGRKRDREYEGCRDGRQRDAVASRNETVQAYISKTELY